MTTIHIVQKDDTIRSIAEQYNISITRLESDNDLSPNQTLVEGQSILIAYPDKLILLKKAIRYLA